MRGYKRVRTLYRVSTLKQMDKEDIPMQRNSCHAFASGKDGWVIEKEYMEKGVSGYHTPSEDRDVLQEIKRDANAGAFDILLVFMFDRIGRREDETPFVVEWLVNRGIEVWSVKEGQQKIENRIDKLLNYMRYWQSGGESEKTSLRVSEKHKQMVEDGQYRGGGTPLGYALQRSGRTNKKGYETMELIIDRAEAEIVRLIFDLYTKKGYGAYRIANYLNENHIRTRRGNFYSHPAVNVILRNSLYIGDYVAGKRKSHRGGLTRTAPSEWVHSKEIQEHLVIIDRHTWEKALAIRAGRTEANSRVTVPRQTKSPLLYAGLTRCGHCGQKMVSRYKDKKWTRKSDRREFRYPVFAYACPQNSAMKACDGQTTYSMKKIEALITPQILSCMEALPGVDLAPRIQQLKDEVTAKYASSLQAAVKQRVKAEEVCSGLHSEIGKAIVGDSIFTKEELSTSLNMKRKEIAELLAHEEALTGEADAHRAEIDGFTRLQEIVPEWVGVFQDAPGEEKKMLLYALIDTIYIYRDRVDIDYKLNLYDYVAPNGECSESI